MDAGRKCAPPVPAGARRSGDVSPRACELAPAALRCLSVQPRRGLGLSAPGQRRAVDAACAGPSVRRHAARDVPVAWEVARDEGMSDIAAVASGRALADRTGRIRCTSRRRPRARALVLVPLQRRAMRRARSGARAPRRDCGGSRRRACASRSPRASSTSRATTAPTGTCVADDLDLVAASSATTSTSRRWGREPRAQPRRPASRTRSTTTARATRSTRRDPDLQAAHAACPWLVTWDDHEVENDYADDRSEDRIRARVVPRAPRRGVPARTTSTCRCRRACAPHGPDMRIYTRARLRARSRAFHVLDDRQYRSYQACPRPRRRGGSNTVDVERCARLPDPDRTMLGAAQERWLDGGLGRLARALERDRAADAHGAVRQQAGPRAARSGPTAGTAIRRRGAACSTSPQASSPTPSSSAATCTRFYVDRAQGRLRRPAIAGGGERVRRHLDHARSLGRRSG